jgi:hypothetical protein
MSNNDDIVGLMFLAALVAAVVSYGLTSNYHDRYYKNKAIEFGAAQYNSQTGDFEWIRWKDKAVEEVEELEELE